MSLTCTSGKSIQQLSIPRFERLIRFEDLELLNLPNPFNHGFNPGLNRGFNPGFNLWLGKQISTVLVLYRALKGCN